MRHYLHVYWILDQRFDFLLPLFEREYGIPRKEITFVGSFHGTARKGEEWKEVKKIHIGQRPSGKFTVKEDDDSEGATGKAVWLEPEDINRAYAEHIVDSPDSLVIAFSGAFLPEKVDSFIVTGRKAAKFNNKWYQYHDLLSKGRPKINTPETFKFAIKVDAEKNGVEDPTEIFFPEIWEGYHKVKTGEEAKERIKKEILEKLSLEGKLVVKKPDLSGGYQMKVISCEEDIVNFCDFLCDKYQGVYLISRYIPHKYSYAGMGIVAKKRTRSSDADVTYCGVTEQVLYHELAYEGLIWPPFWGIRSFRQKGRKGGNKDSETVYTSLSKTEIISDVGKTGDAERSIIGYTEKETEIKRITELIGRKLRNEGYFGYYNVDFIEDSETGKMYVAEINARFGFGTILYALFCGDRFFQAIQGINPPVMSKAYAGKLSDSINTVDSTSYLPIDNISGRRILLGKIKGIKDRQYLGLCNKSEIRNWFKCNVEGEGFREYYLKDEVYGYGSFAGLFGEFISDRLDRESVLVKFMEICLLRGKRLYAIYIDSFCGFEKECFNFDLINRYSISYTDGIYKVRQRKLPEAGRLGFWSVEDSDTIDHRTEQFSNSRIKLEGKSAEDRNVTSLSMMVGKNGSGKTTLIRLAIHWISLFATGKLPNGKGAIIIGTGDGQKAFLSFAGGKIDNSSCEFEDAIGLKHLLNPDDVFELFKDIGLLYFTDTMTDLEMDRLLTSKEYEEITKKQKVFVDRSEVSRLREAVADRLISIQDFRQDIRNIGLGETIRVWRKFGAGQLPFVYVGLNIMGTEHHTFNDNSGLFDDLIKMIEKERCDAVTIGSQNRVLRNRVLLWLFCGILKNIMACFSDEDEKLKKEIAGNAGRLIHGIDKGGEINPDDLKIMIEDANTLKAGKPFIDTDCLKEMVEAIDSFLEYNSDFISRNEEDIARRKYDTYELSINHVHKNTEIERKLLDCLEKCVRKESNLEMITCEHVFFDLRYPSSGECSKTSLYDAIRKSGAIPKQTLLCFFDEPDNSYHIEWKRNLVTDVIDKYQFFPDKSVQLFITSHSPILLSDIPMESQIIFEKKGSSAHGIKGQKRTPRSSFGQQLYTLCYESFEMRFISGMIAEEKIRNIGKEMSEIEEYLESGIKVETNFEDRLDEIENKLERCANIIAMVQEPVVGGALKSQFQSCCMLLRSAKK